MDADTEACQKIINAKSPFECFDLPVERVEPELVRSLYLRIAVKVHPDKNSSHLATQAFQILSESFEELHDEDKQTRHLNKSSAASYSYYHGYSRRKKKRKKKNQDIADLVQQTDKWYTKDWEEVENEINRMTSEFKEHLARQQERHEKQLEKKQEKKRRKEKRIKKNLNFLYEKYGIDPSDSDSDSPSGSYNYNSYLPEAPADQASSEQSKNTDYGTVPGSASAASKESICWICRRSFKSEEMLKLHIEKSELHRTNLAKSQTTEPTAESELPKASVEKTQNSLPRFKSSFSEVTE